MRIIQCIGSPRDCGSYIAVLPAETKGLRASAPKSSGRSLHHLPVGISPETEPEEAASGEGGLTRDSC